MRIRSTTSRWDLTLFKELQETIVRIDSIALKNNILYSKIDCMKNKNTHETFLTRIWLCFSLLPSACRFVQKITLSTATWCYKIIKTKVIVTLEFILIISLRALVLPLSKPVHNQRIQC